MEVNINRARIRKLLRSPGIDAKESIPPGYKAGGIGCQDTRLTESVPCNRFLGSLNVYKFGLWCETILTMRGGPDQKWKCVVYFLFALFVSSRFVHVWLQGLQPPKKMQCFGRMSFRKSRIEGWPRNHGKIPKILRLYFENVHIIVYERFVSKMKQVST